MQPHRLLAVLLLSCAPAPRLALTPAPAPAPAPTPTPTPTPTPAPAPAPAPAPCVSPEFRQLDFWLGDWDVVVRTRSSPDASDWKQARGTNHVVAPLGSCVVEEHFRADGPGAPWAGTSVSTYVPQEHAWRQTWVDDSGSYLAFRGGPSPEGFTLYGEPRPAPPGRSGEFQMRMVFAHATRDAIDWSWERGTPGGGTWAPVMQIHYTRQPPVPAPGTPCDADPTFHDLDFWLGDWKVDAGGKRIGTNHIEKILGGCALVERWRDADGTEGQSLFFHPPGTSTWKQVWITPRATSPGGSKEKELVARFPGGGVRFQGERPAGDGTTVFDRTTLEPIEAGRVDQLIEISRDRGATWTTILDAIYSR